MLRSLLFLVFVPVLFVLALASLSAMAYCAPATLGWQELVRVLPGEPLIEASIDSINEWGSLHVEAYRRIVITKVTAEEKQPPHDSPANTAPRSPTKSTPVTPDAIPSPARPSPKENLHRKVKFTLSDRFGHSQDYELPVLRSMKVKSASGKTEIRPVVPLSICVGNLRIDGEFSLRRDPGQTNHIRLGRQDLAGKALVDPSRSFTLQPSCR